MTVDMSFLSRTVYNNKIENIPVVRTGVHSCSPVAPQSSVQLFVELFGGSMTLLDVP